VWINGLPPEAATWRVDGQQWTLHEELLARLLERTDQWGLIHARLSASPKAQKLLPSKAMEVPRPGAVHEPASKDRVVTAAEIKAFFS
jgi:hypothetical protein